jgi:hypothetical protein
MNLNVVRSTCTLVSIQSLLPISSAPAQNSIENRATGAKKLNLQHSILDIHYSNVLNSPVSFIDEQENLSSKAIETRKQIASQNRIYWWL